MRLKIGGKMLFWNAELQELYLAHEYQMKRQEEKEAARQAREDRREQEKLERKSGRPAPGLKKRASTSPARSRNCRLRFDAASEQQERDDLQTRIDELSRQNSKLDEDERQLDYREQNARAGYVYVISNLGAFGDGVFKIRDNPSPGTDGAGR